MSSGNFCVVEFKDSQDLASVPSQWIAEDLCSIVCAFPPGTRNRARRFAKMNVLAALSWPRYPCEILHTFDSYEAAVKKERFLDSYHVMKESQEHEYGLRKKHRKNYLSSEDEEDESPPPPPPPLVIKDVLGISNAIGLPDVSSSVSSNEQEGIDKISHDLNFADRLGRLEECCSAIQNDVKQVLNLLRTQKDSHASKPESLDVIENYLPLSSLAALYELESHLADSLERREELRVHLQQLGGSSPEEMVKRMLRHLFTDDLAQQFSWMGQKGKNKLCDLLLMKIIFHAVETSKMKGTRDQVVKRIKDWFRHAGARNKYLIQRQSLSQVFYH